MTSIIARIDHAIRLGRERGFQGFRSISLTKDDHVQLKRELGIRLWASIQDYRGIDIRRARHSRLWSCHGVAVNIPRRLPSDKNVKA